MVARAGELVVPPWPMDVRGAQPVAASRRRGARAREVVADAALLLAVAYSLPFVIILAGAPVALVIAVLLWLGGVR